MAEDFTSRRPWASLYAHCNTLASEWHIHRSHDSSEVNQQRPKSGQRPISWKSPHVSPNSWNTPPPSFSFSFSSVAQSCPTLCEQHARLLCPSQCPGVWSRIKLMSIESVMPSNHLILCHPLLHPPSIFPSIRVFFTWVSSLHQVAKVLEFQL